MEVKSRTTALELNRAAAGVENSGSRGQGRQQSGNGSAAAIGENPELEEQSVMVSISAAGLKRSLSLEKQADNAGEDAQFSEGEALEEMMKKIEGLSSQVINGYFSASDRLNFNNEIKRLTSELNRLNSGEAIVTVSDYSQLSKKINDLTKIISDSAVYHKSASAAFMVNKKSTNDITRTQLDIAI